MRRLQAILLAVVTAAVFLPTVGYEFVEWDDVRHLKLNPLVYPPAPDKLLAVWRHPYDAMYIPVTYMTWEGVALLAAQQQADGSIELNPYLFHLLSVSLHVVNVLLLWALARRLTGSNWPAWLGAMVFAVHPLQVESVAWVSAARDLLCAGFSLAAVHQWLSFRQSQRPVRWSNLALASACFALAMLAKPTGVVVPVIAALADAWTARRWRRGDVLALLAWLVMTIPCLLWTRALQPGGSMLGPPPLLWQRPLVAADAVAFYLYKLLLPLWLGIDYGRTPQYVLHGWTWVSGIVPAALAAALLAARAWKLLLAGAIFLAGLLPVLGLVQFNFQYYSTVTDHYVYLPMLGVAMAVAVLAARHHTVEWCAAYGVALAALAGITLWQNTHWRDNHALVTRALEVNPSSFAGHFNLAIGLEHEHKPRQAEDQFRMALRIHPDHVPARYELGQLLMDRGEADQGLDELVRAAHDAAAQDPQVDLRPLFRRLAEQLRKRGRNDEARRLEQEASQRWGP